MKEDFTTHACEQVLRFSQAENWNDLSEERKVQLGFNMGVMVLGLGLSKEQGFLALSNARESIITMRQFREHIMKLVEQSEVIVDQEKISRPF